MSDTFTLHAPTRVVEVRGADRCSYLDAVTSQALTDLAVGEVRGALYLDAHGGPLAIFDVVACQDHLLLLVPDPDLGDVVVTTLGGRTFLADAAFTARDDAVIVVRGPDAAAVATSAGFATSPDGPAAAVYGDVVRVRRRGGVDLVTPHPETTIERVLAAGARHGSAEDLEHDRIAAGEPAWAREVVAGRLPEELGLLPTHVHLAKGCYPGQEAVARMWMLGRPRRRLAVMRPDDGVDVGWTHGEGRHRVEVTSVAARDGEPRALGFVPPDLEAGARVAAPDGRGVTVLGIVGADEAVPGHDPAVTRRRDRA